MPRPPKHVPPDTLGGRIRAARERLNLSLANVAGGRYSTSLISQIERNRVEPSQESLQFLADQLHIPLSDLLALAQQHRETEAEAREYKTYEELMTKSVQLLQKKQAQQALTPLKGLSMPHVPPALRWRLAALRGQCYFAMRQFLIAQRDFLYAITEKPEEVPPEYRLEALTLHLHLAVTHRELEQAEAAFEQYHIALNMMDSNTSLLYVAEAHWGISLIAFERANKMAKISSSDKEAELRTALQHAENACILYRSIGEKLLAALLTCQIALIEQTLGHLDKAREHLLSVLVGWQPLLEEQIVHRGADKRRLKELANVVSAAACSLAGVELEAHNYQDALNYVHRARYAATYCYILRRAEAEMMLGRILEAINKYDPNAEAAFRAAIAELSSTDRIAARVRAYDLLGRHLLKKGSTEAGEDALDQARRLSHVASALNSTISTDGDSEDGNRPI